MPQFPSNPTLDELMQDALDAHQHGRLPEAERLYRRVLNTDASHAEATHFLGLLEHQQGHAQVALELLRRSIDLSPVSPLYRHNLAGVYKELGRYAEAEELYRQVLSICPSYVDSHIGLATVLIAQDDYTAALQSCEHALALAPACIAALQKKGEALHGSGDDQAAIEIYRGLVRTMPTDARGLHVVGMALHAAGANADAVNVLRVAARLAPGSWEIHNSLGVAAADLGDLAGAEASYRVALNVKPDCTGAIYNLVQLGHMGPDDPLWPALMTLGKRVDTLTPLDAIPLHFALGSLWDQRQEYDLAFKQFSAGNRKKRATIDYDEQRQVRFYRNCMQSLPSRSAQTNVSINRTGAAGFTPIFILGVPRSGTTLVEQILTSHPQIHGTGETQQLWRAVRTELHISARSDDDAPLLLMNAPQAVLARIADRYQSALRSLAPEAKAITDKLPGNVTLVRAIHAALPRAKIVHCLRDPVDTCVSCYARLFTSGQLFSYDLAELGRFYRRYERLMNYWSEMLPEGSVLDVRYEDVVADLEGQARRLVSFCGLDWNARCLRFYATNRAVATASLAQVRQPIYTHSIGRWRHYAQYLGPLTKALADQPSIPG